MIVVISNPVFGKNMRFLRRKYGLSRKSLAMLLGVDPKLIRRGKLRSGPTRVSISPISL